MANHELRDLIKEILIEQIEQLEHRELILIEQREQIKQLEQLEQILLEQREQLKLKEKRSKTVKPPFNQVSNKQYHYVINCIRFFLIEKGLFECCSQYKFPILSSHNEYTHQLYLEYELLQNSNVTGYFCVTNVNIEHTNSISDSIPAVEFVINGDIKSLESFTHDLLVYLSYPNISNYIVKDYSYITTKLNMNINYLSNTVKQKIYTKFGATFLLKNYPSNTPAHWTIKKNINTNTYNKLVTILSGVETIFSYEVSTNTDDMRNQFNASSHLFNNADVNAELDQYLTQSFTPRSYGKILTLSLIDSMIKERLIPDFYM
jgi:hypothetical protein